MTEGDKEGNNTRSKEAANQRSGRCDGVVGRGQPLGLRLMNGIERWKRFRWGRRMDCGCISVTVVPDDRYKGAEQTEQVESKETTKSNITSTRVFQAEGKRRCWKQSFLMKDKVYGKVRNKCKVVRQPSEGRAA